MWHCRPLETLGLHAGFVKHSRASLSTPRPPKLPQASSKGICYEMSFSFSVQIDVDETNSSFWESIYL